MSEEEEKKILNIAKKIVYTHCGYGTIQVPSENQDSVLREADLSKLSEMVTVNLKSGGSLSLSKDLLQPRIKLRLKTFHGTRKILEVEVDVNDTVERFKELILEADADKELETFKQLKFFYPMGKMRELKGINKICDLDIPGGALLLGYGVRKFIWNELKKGDDISIENNGLTAVKNREEDYQSVLASVGFSSGRCYWEITINQIVENEDVIVGVSSGDIDLYKHPEEVAGYWGYFCCAGRKVSSDDCSNYGDFCSLNDRIGVLLEFRKNEASVSFYRNGKSMGIAYPSIPLNTYYPVVTMYCSVVKITLDSTAQIPLNL